MATKKEFTSFEDMIAQSELPVLVDFYATWCGPCQLMAKILVQVNAQLKEQMQIVKVDTDRYPEIASRHEIQALPTLVLFKQGNPVERIEGVLPVEDLIPRLRSRL